MSIVIPVSVARPSSITKQDEGCSHLDIETGLVTKYIRGIGVLCTPLMKMIFHYIDENKIIANNTTFRGYT